MRTCAPVYYIRDGPVGGGRGEGYGSVETAVAFLIFNRPDTTARVFARIREARPSRLLVVADGPRADRPGEAERCAAARAVVDGVDWDCDLLTSYAEENLGCLRRVTSGLDWVFSTVPEAIVLEDDCLPDPTFFRFCQELLGRYRDDQRVAMVSGGNYQFGRRRTSHSYYFSRYTHIWGWATWRRAWRHCDAGLGLWPEVRDSGLLPHLLGGERAARYWGGLFERAHRGEADAWSYCWLFACWAQSGLTVLPNVNLVSNIGFAAGATHTTGASRLAALPTEPMPFPLEHPACVFADPVADGHTERELFSGEQTPARSRALGRLSRLFR